MLQYASILLLALGLYGVIINKNVIKLLISLNVFEVGLNLFIISIAYIKGGVMPILSSEQVSPVANMVDPLPHALVLTAIVIGVGTTAVGLALAKKMYQKYGTYDLNDWGVK